MSKEKEDLFEGDPAALESWAREHTDLLKALAFRNFSKYGYNADSATCEDICSQVWHQLYDKDRSLLRQCMRENRLLPMLHTLARNRCVDHIRKHRRFHLSDEELAPETPRAEPEQTTGLHREWLIGHVRDLPGREREVIELFYLQDLSYREIHQVSGIPENSIGPTLKRALKHLRQRIESEENHVL